MQQLQSPPTAARPMVRWWWFGAAVEKPEILRELHQMKADGIGGFELAFVYPLTLDHPEKGIRNLPFVSPEFLECVRYAQTEGRRLGLRADVTLGSGWPYGGPATPLSQAAGRLKVLQLALPAGATALPPYKLDEGESVISISLVPGEPKHWQASGAVTLPASASTTLPQDHARTVLVFVASHTRQAVKRAAVGAEGFVLDPFSHDAVATHLQAVGQPLLSAFGSTPPYAVFSDSLEAYGADWTPGLPAEFQRRRGYDLLPHLPELVAGDTAAAQAVRHDWGQTLTELVNENYLTQINQWALAHHTKFRSQTYGEPAVNLSSQRLVSLPEGEGPQWRQFSTLRWATSANHLFGNNVTSGETFTWLHSPVFRATPLDMKAEADVDFLTGENQLIFHGWPYSPPATALPAGDPGWSLYAAAVFNDHNPWHPVMPQVTRYIQRVSFLLRQGRPANQVAVLLPTDDAWSAFSPGKVTVTGEMARLITPQLVSTILAAGYNLDFIDAETIHRQGLHHQILVLPPTDRIPLQTLREIADYKSQGGKVIAVGHAPSLQPNSQPSSELSNLADRLFRGADSTLVPDDAALTAALHLAAQPDMELTNTPAATLQAVGFIRRRLPGADIYFVANTSNQAVQATVRFVTAHHYGSSIDPDTLAAQPTTAASQTLILAPYESRIYLFDQNHAPAGGHQAPTLTAANSLGDLSTGWQVTFPGLRRTVPADKLTDWIDDEATRHYSGEAVYSHEVQLAARPAAAVYLQVLGGKAVARPGHLLADDPNTTRPAGAPLPNPLVTRTGPGMRAWYDPPVREAALVVINGEPAGALWHPPYRLDVTRYLHAGQNRIEIHVFNTALNAWSANPPRDYKPLIAKYGDRFQMQDLDQVKPIPSGLLGTVQLVTEPTQP